MSNLVWTITAVCLAVAPSISAQDAESRKVTVLTFSSEVQLPGFVLPPGTYQFAIADPDTSRRVIEVSNEKGTKAYGFLLTMPDNRLTPSHDPVVMFSETTKGSAAAVRAWFYPGETTGYEFVYPKDQAVAIARLTHERVLAIDRDDKSTGTERVRYLHGAKVSRVDDQGHFSGEEGKGSDKSDK